MKILLADDSATMRSIEMAALKAAGYEDIVEVDGGDRALEELASRDDIALVLMDWNMPVMNGIDCLRAIRSNEKTRTLPVIMVTSESLKERVMEALQAGANNYLVKPFEPLRLRRLIEETMKKAGV